MIFYHKVDFSAKKHYIMESMNRVVVFAPACLAALMAAACTHSKGGTEMADLVLVNGIVRTMDPAGSTAEAVAVRGGRIVRIGRSADLKAMAGPDTRVVDLEGAAVLPGFIDSHTHFLSGGFALASIQLRDVRSRGEFASRVAAKVGETDKGEWILNGDWDHEQFSPVELPRRDWIDAVSPDNPVCVSRYDGHMVLVNGAALAIAGITRDTPVPPGGEIVKDPKTGEPTGILKDAAADLVYRRVPEVSMKAKLRAAETALRHAAEHGVTSVHEMADASSFEVYQELLRQGRMTARLNVYIPIDEVGLYARLKLKTPFGNDFLKIGGLKGFVDGSLGSTTAYFFEPYADDPSTSGLLAAQMFPEGIMEKRVLEADRAGLQVAIHAIGDRANSLLLDIYEKAYAQNGPRDRRWRIEHAQHLKPEDIARFGRFGLIASAQPYHAYDDGRWAEKRIGKERARTTYAFKSLRAAGAVLAFGSDWTVAPLDPVSGIYAAVTRATSDGRNPGGWIPEEKISVEEAVRGYTSGGAYAEFAEKEKGTIETGKLADLVVLDKDLFAIPADRLRDARVIMTVVGGKIVHETPK
jgi:predicted amidohydrolase YtcJ